MTPDDGGGGRFDPEAGTSGTRGSRAGVWTRRPARQELEDQGSRIGSRINDGSMIKDQGSDQGSITKDLVQP